MTTHYVFTPPYNGQDAPLNVFAGKIQAIVRLETVGAYSPAEAMLEIAKALRVLEHEEKKFHEDALK